MDCVIAGGPGIGAVPPGMGNGGEAEASPQDGLQSDALFADTLGRLVGAVSAEGVTSSLVGPVGPTPPKHGSPAAPLDGERDDDDSADEAVPSQVSWLPICTFPVPVALDVQAVVSRSADDADTDADADQSPIEAVDASAAAAANEVSAALAAASLTVPAVTGPVEADVTTAPTVPETPVTAPPTAQVTPAALSTDVRVTAPMDLSGIALSSRSGDAERARDESRVQDVTNRQPPVASPAARSLARALAVLERAESEKVPDDHAQVQGQAPKIRDSGAASTTLTAGAERGAAIVPDAVSIDSSEKLPGAVRRVASEHAGAVSVSGNDRALQAGAGPSFGDASGNQAGSARQDYGRRAFAAAVAHESSTGTTSGPAPAVTIESTARAGAPVMAQPASAGEAPVVEARAVSETVLTRSAADEAEIVPQIVRAMRTQFRDGIGEAQIRLKPEHLGEVRIEVKIDGDRVSAVLQVERQDVRQAIEAQSQSLRSGLAAQGLRLDDLTVTKDDRPNADRQTPEDQRRGQGQQPPPDRRSRRRQADREFELEA